MQVCSCTWQAEIAKLVSQAEWKRRKIFLLTLGFGSTVLSPSEERELIVAHDLRELHKDAIEAAHSLSYGSLTGDFDCCAAPGWDLVVKAPLVVENMLPMPAEFLIRRKPSGQTPMRSVPPLHYPCTLCQ